MLRDRQLQGLGSDQVRRGSERRPGLLLQDPHCRLWQGRLRREESSWHQQKGMLQSPGGVHRAPNDDHRGNGRFHSSPVRHFIGYPARYGSNGTAERVSESAVTSRLNKGEDFLSESQLHL